MLWLSFQICLSNQMKHFVSTFTDIKKHYAAAGKTIETKWIHQDHSTFWQVSQILQYLIKSHLWILFLEIFRTASKGLCPLRQDINSLKV